MADHEHDPHLAHHFETPQQQFEAGKLGMWIFLVTEVLLFSGLFCVYAAYRANHPEIFVYAHRFLSKTLGAVNTVILICSSFTMALAVHCAQTGRQRGLVVNLVLTLLFACGFLGVKAIEYKHKWQHGLLWGSRFRLDPHLEAEYLTGGEAAALEHVRRDSTSQPTTATAPAVPATTGDAAARPATKGVERSAIAPPPDGPPGLAKPPPPAAGRDASGRRPSNVQVFFGVYFVMTGLHGLHVLAGMAVIGWILLRASRDEFGPRYFAPVDLAGLYWHLVDIIWIFLFPLLYLIH